ncbi:MAG: 60S ribosomal protein L22 [Candidatus Bathyarchaeota archaeon]|nr:60S ribosomal protein L22 [Candidatus Bathyarchaeum tardum]WNZ29406.1 MAG: 60S ribosomal protein L22 [Candidatus Bathyarchaeota archaeon]
MSNTVIDVSEIANYDDACVKELTVFLKEKVDGTVSSTKKEVTVTFEDGKEASRSCMRLLLKKFLHNAALQEDFRVISGDENGWVLKEKKVYVE